MSTPTPPGAPKYAMTPPPGAPAHGAAAGADPHDDIPGANPDSVRAGHEPDQFNIGGIIFVPIGVVIAAALTYGLVTVLFGVFDPGTPETKGANPQAAEKNLRPYNERIVGIDSSDVHAPVKQPRLEGMRTIANGPKEPPFMRSFKQPDASNPPEIRPEYLRAENYIDWNTGEKPLADYKWVDKEKGIARIPVGDAIHILATQKKLPAKAGHPTGATVEKPKLSNGGQAMTVEHQEKKGDHKKDEKKDAHDHDHKKDEKK